MQIHIKRDGKQYGPYSLQDITIHVRDGNLTPEDSAWYEGAPDWMPLKQVPGISLPITHLVPPPPGSNVTRVVMLTKPDNNLLGAIVSTLCCCLPFGIVSIVYAAQVNSKWEAGDHDGAMAAARNAKMWYHITLVAGLVVGGIWTVVNFITR